MMSYDYNTKGGISIVNKETEIQNIATELRDTASQYLKYDSMQAKNRVNEELRK